MLPLLSLTLLLPCCPQEPAPAPEAKPIYDEAADPDALVGAALERAERDHQRVLVVLGGNWCGWCRKLHDLFASDRKIRRALLYEYQVVPVDIGDAARQARLAERWGARFREEGVPYLVVLDAAGKVLARQETGALEDGDHHDPARVLAFLEKWKAPPLDARQVLAGARKQATAGGRRIFLHFGAPWCGWCHRLEDFLALPEVARLLARDYLDVKVDVDRMLHGQELLERYRGSKRGGIPWTVILDAEGKALVSSDGPEGNIGYPVDEWEIGWFLEMLRRTRQRLDDAALEGLEGVLRRRAEEILRSRRQASRPGTAAGRP